MSELYPTEIDISQVGRVSYAWSDGHAGFVSWNYLRWNCPCAECSGEMGQPGRLDHIQSLPGSERRLVDIEPVGLYALKPIWASGHQSGLFTYARLRGLCECEACGGEQGDFVKRAVPETDRD